VVNIREARIEDVDLLAEIICSANQMVADQLGLNAENAPTHPSHCQPDWIQRDFDKGILYFILEVDGNPIGCVALEQVENNVCYLERLAVHPKYQEQGYGRKLVEFFLEKAKSLGNQKVGIAIIQQHEQLRRWYLKLGFIETTSKQFDHLPFTVQFMELKL